jgi:hypothetical protein
VACVVRALVLNCDSVRDAKCTRLVYEIRLSRLYTLDLPLALAFLRSRHAETPDLGEEKNQRTLDKSHVPQADPPATGLYNSN